MTNGYKPRVGDLLVYDTNVYRVVAVKDEKYADVRRDYAIVDKKLVAKSGSDVLTDIRVSCFERQIYLKAKVV